MTNDEVRNVLRKTSRLVNVMDKAQVKDLLKILIDAQCKKNCASFIFIDMRRTVKKLLQNLIKTENLNHTLSRKHMKQIFAIIGDYGVFPICNLCGRPVKITTDGDHSGQMDFSWDHQIPKSKGGGYDLENLEPTHQICNNKRGTQPIKRAQYRITFDIDVDVVFDLEELCDCKNLRYRPDRFGLRKQDWWCHKQHCLQLSIQKQR